MRARAATNGFSLVELVLVVAIIGIIGAIALPKMGSTAERTRSTSLAGNLCNLQRGVDLYAAEHADRGPATETDGTPTASGVTVVQRLLRHTDDFGNMGGVYGPYLHSWPTNPYNGKKSLRIDGAAAGANADGWRINSSTLKIEADHGALAAHAVAGGGLPAAEDGG